MIDDLRFARLALERIQTALSRDAEALAALRVVSACVERMERVQPLGKPVEVTQCCSPALPGPAAEIDQHPARTAQREPPTPPRHVIANVPHIDGRLSKPMKQADLGLSLTTKRTRKREFLAQMERVVPWAALVDLVAPHAPEGKKGRPPFPVQTMLRIHFMQQWFTLSDPAMEEALHDIALFREFAGLGWDSRLPDETTILRFRRLLEKHKLAEQMLATVNELLSTKGLMLKTGTVVDATLIAAPSSTKNASGERDPEMHQAKKGNQWHFGMKAHIGVDAQSGMVHTVRGTSANVNDVVEANSLLHGQETDVHGDAGYQGQPSGPTPSPVSTGTSPCDRANARRWTRPTPCKA
jgi:IS5 family transposase